MSSEWSQVTLGDILTLQRGIDLPIQSRKHGTVPIIASTGITGYHNFAPVKAPGVVIGRSGSIGGGQYIEQDFHPLNTTLWVKDFKGNNPRFCYYLLRSIDFSGLNVGSGVPTLNRNHLHPMPMPCPPIKAQKEIATTLGALDDRITLLRETNATLEAIAQALFKSWFVDFDPVHAKAQGTKPEGMDEQTAALFPDSFEESELGMVPAGWEVGTLENCCLRVESGGTPKRTTSEYWNGEISWLTSGEVRQPIVFETKETITELGIKESSAKIWETGTTVVAMYGATAGEVCLLAQPSTANQACCGLIPRKDFRTFLFFCVRRESQNLASKSSGSAQQNLNKGLVAGHQVLIPSEQVVTTYEKITGTLLNSWISNEKKAKTLANLRDTLLPRLISGQLRLPDVVDHLGEI